MHRTRTQCLLGGLILTAALAPQSALAAPATTWSRTIGNLCLQGIPIASRQIEQTENNNGVPVEQFRVDYASAAPPANILVRAFRTPPQAASPLTRCQDLRGEVVLEGRIKKLTIRGARETGPGVTPAHFEVGANPDSFIEIELTKVKSSLAPLYGGMIQLGRDGSIAPSELAWIRNAGAITTSSGSPGQGAIEIETWGRNLRGAHVQLPGSAETVRTDLSAGNSNVTLRVNIDGSLTELRKGRLTSGRLRLSQGDVTLPGSSFKGFSGEAASLEISARESGVETKLTHIKYSADAGTFGSTDSNGTVANADGTIATILGSGARSGEKISFADPVTLQHVVAGSNCRYAYRGAALTEASDCRFTIARATAGDFDGTFVTDNPRAMLAAEAFVPRGPVHWKLASAGGNDTLSGGVALAQTRFGALAINDARIDFTQPAASASELSIPFSIHIGPAQGNWTLGNGGEDIVLTGKLEELTLKGSVGVPISAPADWTIRVAQNDLRFGGGVTGEVRPHIYGGSPLYAAGTDLRFAAGTDLEIAKARRSGKIDTSVSVFALSSMDLELGERASNMVLKGPVRFDAGVKLRYDIDRGSARITEGSFDLTNLHLQSKPGTYGDLATIRVHDADLVVDRIFARFAPNENQGSLGLTGLTLAIGRVEQRPDVGADQTKWSGDLEGPMTVNSITASIVPNPDSGALELRDEKLAGLKLQLTRPRFGQGRDLRFGGKSLALDFPELSRANVVGTVKLRDAGLYRNEEDAEFAVKDLDLTLNLLGGPLDKPNGDGRLRTGAVYANIDTDFKLTFEACDGDPRFRSLPVNVKFATASTDVDLRLTDGKLHADGHAGASGSVINSTGGYECKKRLVAWRIVKEVRAKYKYPCPTWRKPFRMCRGWTTIIPEVRADVERVLRIRRMHAAGVFTSVDLKIYPENGGTKFQRCLKKGAFVPALDVSYFITPKTSIRIADNIFKEIIDLHSRPFMSAFTSSLVSGLGNSQMFLRDGWCV